MIETTSMSMNKANFLEARVGNKIYIGRFPRLVLYESDSSITLLLKNRFGPSYYAGEEIRKEVYDLNSGSIVSSQTFLKNTLEFNELNSKLSKIGINSGFECYDGSLCGGLQ